MTDCSQLPAQLDDALQQLSQLAQNPVKYCKDEADGDINFFKACMSTQGQLRNYFNQLISQLRGDIAFCNLLIGTWTITATVRDNSGNTIDCPAYSGQLRIDSWDTGTEALGGRIDVPVNSSDFPIIQGSNYIFATFKADTLKLDISIASPPLIYDGTLDVGTGMITGLVEGAYEQGQIPSWFAIKL